MDEENTNMISTSKEQRKSAHTSREYSEPDLNAAARIQHEKEMDELKNEKAVLTKKLRAIKKYEVQSACMKVELGKFRALALNPSLFAVYSEPIHLAGFEWKLCAERSFDNCLGLFLCIYVPDPSTKEWECQVNFTFCIKHTTDMDACIHRGNMRPVVFSQVLGRCGRSGYPDIIGIHHLLDPQSGFVDLQDCIQMGVSFSVLYSTLA